MENFACVTSPEHGSFPASGGRGETLTGDPKVRLRALVLQHYEFVWRLLRRLGVEVSVLDDEAQRVFMLLDSKLLELELGKEAAFLTAISVRVASNARRAAKRKQNRESDYASQAPEPQTPSPDVLVQRKRDRELLDLILDELPQEQRVVFVLSELEGMSRGEISKALQVPIGTVASRFRLAQEKFFNLAEHWRRQREQEGQ